MYIKRTCEKMIESVSCSFPCIVVYGPRQVGKSTTIDFLYGGKYRKVSLDNAEDRLLAQNNPKLFLETYRWPIIIDEIQKAPGLLDEIKIVIDAQRLSWIKSGEDRSLMYILTGSNRFELQQGISDSLAGRCGIMEMSSFSHAEKYGYDSPIFSPQIEDLRKIENSGRYIRTRKEIFEDIFTGGMPDICTGVSQREVYFKSYINTYIEKDVMKLISASQEMNFMNFLSIAALRTGQELHYDEIAGKVGIDVRTCKRWISILQTSGIVYLLHPYMSNFSNRIIKSPKLYFTDTGLCSYLCRWPNAEMLESCAMSGAFFETYVVGEIVKNLSAYNRNPSDNVFYYRDIDKKEIDILFVESGDIYPIEIKKGIFPTKPTKNFSVLEKYQMNIKPGIIIDSCDRIRAVNEIAYSVPVDLL